MSGLEPLPRPGPRPAATPTHPSNPTLLTMPVLQQSPPYWVDPSAVAAAAPQPATQHIHYIAVAQQPPSSANPPTEPSIPRPRKPYTTTKVREMWSNEEHDRMLEGLRLYKRDWAKVTRFVGTRSAAQVRSHAQKYFDKVARDKTDDYVPRARPKRKSATPYPRKARDHHPTQQQNLLQSPQSSQTRQVTHPATSPMPPPIPMSVQSLHPSPALPMHQQATIAHAHPMHHPSVPVQFTTQSPLVPQIQANSPCLSQPPQPNVTVQPGVQQHVYSPYLALYPPPPPGQDPQRIHASPVPHASPISFMGSPYTGHSPAPHPQMHMPQSHQQVYSMFSPMTPAGYPHGMGRSPSVNHAQVSLVAAPPMQARPVQQQHIPTHSHPGGPMENCAKCAALQRYGNVLQEIGEFRHPVMQQQRRAHQAEVAATKQTATHAAQMGRGHNAEVVKNPPRTNAAERANLGSTQCPEGIGSSSGRGRNDGPRFSSTRDPKHRGLVKGAADHRAHRAKVMKARKAKNRNQASKSPSKSPSVGESEESNESFNSSRVRMDESSTKASNKDLQRNNPDSNLTEKRPKKKGRNTNGASDERPAKRSRRSIQAEACDKMVSTEDLSSTVPDVRGSSCGSGNSSPSTREIGDKSERSDGKRTNSPGVELYSPSERKEIFDAVKSLQILAKTSSSSSREPKPIGANSTSET